MKKSPVYIVFCETVSPLGINSSILDNSLLNNYIATSKITQFCPDGLLQTQACEVKQNLKEYLPLDGKDWQSIAQHDRKFELIAAVIGQHKPQLLELLQSIPTKRKGISLGIGANVFPMENIALEVRDISTKGLFDTLIRVNQLVAPNFNTVFNHIDVYSQFIQQELRSVQSSKNILTACSSSTQSIAYAASKIMLGQADAMIAGGTDSILNNFAYISFGKLGVLTTESCKPFDINRTGAIAGECAGIAILASENAVKSMGVIPEYELIGFGNTLDAFKITAPNPNGFGVENAMRKAISMSGILPREINYINAHGTGTRSNDEVELKAIERVLGESASQTYVSSTKDRHGHSIAAAGIQEFNVLLSAMKNKIIPANLGTSKPLNSTLQIPIKTNIHQETRIGMTNNFAFGGVNCSLIIKNLAC